ncbi:MAG: hypothetical protein QM640_09525 [Niabella sp.]
MKKFLTITFILICYAALGQKIKTDRIDKTTKERVIESSGIKIPVTKIKISNPEAYGEIKGSIQASILAVGNQTLLHLTWFNTLPVGIDKADSVTVTDEQGNNYIFKFTDFSVSKVQKNLTSQNSVPSYYNDIFLYGDISAFINKSIQHININTYESNTLKIQLREKEQSELKKAAELVIKKALE